MVVLHPNDVARRVAVLREHHLAAIPSSIFYDNEATCPRFLRFQFAVESPVLDEAARRLRRATP